MGKVFKNGNSLAVTVPKAFAHQLNIKDGSKIEWEKTEKGLVLSSARRVKASGVDQKFAKMVDQFVTEHQDVLQALSKR